MKNLSETFGKNFSKKLWLKFVAKLLNSFSWNFDFKVFFKEALQSLIANEDFPLNFLSKFADWSSKFS